jgi:hypothetical protein
MALLHRLDRLPQAALADLAPGTNAAGEDFDGQPFGHGGS